MTESIAFDRAAEFYDRTRGSDAESTARTVARLEEALAGRGRVLEVGAGTGLLTIPLHAAGVDVVGLDLSPPMLAKLLEKASDDAPPVVLGDATALPFGDGAFGATYLRWVLHLIPDWRSVLAEVVRVVGPGGLFLANLGAYDGPRHEIQERFAEITGIPIEPVGLNWGAEDELDAEMARHGAQVRELEALVQGGEETMGSFIDEIRENSYSWTWRVPDDVRLRAADEIEPWARERFGDLDAVRRWELAVIWRAYDLP